VDVTVAIKRGAQAGDGGGVDVAVAGNGQCEGGVDVADIVGGVLRFGDVHRHAGRYRDGEGETGVVRLAGADGLALKAGAGAEAMRADPRDEGRGGAMRGQLRNLGFVGGFGNDVDMALQVRVRADRDGFRAGGGDEQRVAARDRPGFRFGGVEGAGDERRQHDHEDQEQSVAYALIRYHRFFIGFFSSILRKAPNALMVAGEM
jgi:hypothetical protein